MLGGTGKEWIGDVSREKIATYWRYDNKFIRAVTPS
jgi:hypothetical protein